MALRKLEGVGDAARPQTFGQPADGVLYPSLWEHLACTTYPDGSPRQTSTVIIVADGNVWKGCLSDKDNGRVAWKNGGSLDELLQLLELVATTEDPRDWRRAAEATKKRR